MPLLIVNGTVAAIVVNGDWFVSEIFAVRNRENRQLFIFNFWKIHEFG